MVELKFRTFFCFCFFRSLQLWNFNSTTSTRKIRRLRLFAMINPIPARIGLNRFEACDKGQIISREKVDCVPSSPCCWLKTHPNFNWILHRKHPFQARPSRSRLPLFHLDSTAFQFIKTIHRLAFTDHQN